MLKSGSFGCRKQGKPNRGRPEDAKRGLSHKAAKQGDDEERWENKPQILFSGGRGSAYLWNKAAERSEAREVWRRLEVRKRNGHRHSAHAHGLGRFKNGGANHDLRRGFGLWIQRAPGGLTRMPSGRVGGPMQSKPAPRTRRSWLPVLGKQLWHPSCLGCLPQASFFAATIKTTLISEGRLQV